MSTTRSRVKKIEVPGGVEYLSTATPSQITHQGIVELGQTTTSEGHPFPRLKSEGMDLGGEFYTRNQEYEVTHAPTVSAWTTDRYNSYIASYNGRIYASLLDLPGTGDSFAATGSSLDALGTTAISRTIPTNPVVDGSTFFGELVRDGFPAVIGAATLGLKKGGLAGDFLNFEFGVLPLISDIRNFLKAVTKSEMILTQLRRDSGRVVRRRYYFPIELTSTETSNVGTLAGFKPWPQPVYSSYWPFDYTLSRSIKHTSIKKEVWFSGAYTYYLDMGDETHDKLIRYSQYAKKLLGIRLTPDVLWNLAPWSWMIDWVTNLGDVFHNVSAFASDGLVLRYGYVMAKTTHRYSKTVTGIRPLAGRNVYQDTLLPVSTTSSFVLKQRRKATPYGFGLELDGFDLRQWAILGALGMTRAPQVLFK
nr:MAG: hypothetical protein 1 [Leviviridae sp.]